ncbi:MAG: type II toxin-antitoxin system RelE/ParE family toxin [Myxococcota bacterium]|nr:type II toxin-antitoxin system RelE/ParE family toxin [Myxococcota bacterium]
MYAIEIGPAAERSLKKLSADIQKRIIKAILKLEKQPRPAGVKKLSGEDDIYRIRVRDYRVIYQIRDDVLVIVVVRVGHRRDVYR